LNNLEFSMLELLRKGREEYGVLAVKAEFEAEGTRTDELLRLLEVARKANVQVGLKIGGCEAVRDLQESRLYGADYIIAPMVETPYALTKYIAAKDKVYPRGEQEHVGFLFNLETRSSFDHLDEMGAVAEAHGVGFVFGRVDFAGSMGRQRDFVNSDEMTDYVRGVAEVARNRNLNLVTGGGVSPEGISALRRIREIRLDRFETRKVIFDAAVLDGAKAASGIELAVEFELLWLQNKRDYYGAISAEDNARIEMMERRQRSKAA
jgi:hypothetical protein